jgi:hypothetical protein
MPIQFMRTPFRFFFFPLLLCTIAASAQKATLSGTVVDGQSKETIPAAVVNIVETNQSVITDIDGLYLIRSIPAGTYTVKISYLGYQTLTVTGIEIPADGKVIQDFALSTGTIEMEAITVTDFREKSSVQSVIAEIKSMPQVASGISSQQMLRTVDNTAAQSIQRVPGITIADNRFVMIRGLNERYNSVLINNVVAPSTEVDKRTFSFDLISTNALERMLIFKSGSADLPGDYAGGVIKLYTVDNVDKAYTKISVGTGFRAGTSMQDYYQSNGSSTDFLGFDNSYRRLPDNFPTTDALQRTNRSDVLRQTAAHSLNNNFNPNQSTAIPDFSINATFGRRYTFGKERLLTVVNAIGISQSYQHYNRDFLRYFEWEDRDQPIDQRFSFVDQVYQKDNKINVLSNWKLKWNEHNTISFKNLFNQIGENETYIRNGRDFIQRPNDNLRNYMLGYKQRSIYSGQLQGNHDLNHRLTVTWVGGASILNELEPDLRRFRTFRSRDLSENDPYSMQLPPSSNLFDTGRYYGELFEYGWNHGADVLYKFDDDGNWSIKTGYYVDLRDREFSSRYMSYLYPGFSNPNIREELIILPLTEIFSNTNVKPRDGFVLEEGTRPDDSYDASSFTSAAYVHFQGKINTQIQVNGGLRFEYNLQKLSATDQTSNDIRVRNPLSVLMPFLNTSYALSDDHQFRFAYARTVNRPEFRELAPFNFYDYKVDALRTGNPNLKSAVIDNFDLRYEYYPRVGEVMNVGVFYKKFKNPIENRNIVQTESPGFSYINATEAYNYGIEGEIRKSFLGLTESALLDRFSINANASWIVTEVDLGRQASAQVQRRPLQGQSPYIFNASVYYDDAKRGISGSLVYNIFGSRIYSVGDVNFPTIFEMPRNSVDLTMSVKTSKQATLKVSVQDLLNAPFRFYQDSDRNEKANLPGDDVIFRFRRGQLIGFSYSVEL